MLAAVTAGAGHPAVAALFGLGSAGLAGAVVAMTWSVHARQIRLAELLSRRQIAVTPDPEPPAQAVNGNGNGHETAVKETVGAAAAGARQPAVIDGPETVVTGEQARYRVRASNGHKVVSWAVGGGSVSQAPDPSHPDELLLIADRPGDLTIFARVREGMAERRETKTVTAVPDVVPPEPPFTLRLFLHGWGLIVVAVLIVGLAGALDALGNFSSSDFIALVTPVTALLGIAAVARGAAEASSHSGNSKGHGPT